MKNLTKTQLAKKATNTYIKNAQTTVLGKILAAFNYHYNINNKSREELLTLVRVERNRALWGQYATA